MTDGAMPSLDAVPKRGGSDGRKELAEGALVRLMACDVEGQIGAGGDERSVERTTRRDGQPARGGGQAQADRVAQRRAARVPADRDLGLPDLGRGPGPIRDR